MPKRAPKRDRGPKWSSPKQADRNRPKVTLTLSPECVDALEHLAAKYDHKKSVIAEASVFSQVDAMRSHVWATEFQMRCDRIKAEQNAAKRRR